MNTNELKLRILGALDRMDEQGQEELAALADQFAELFPKAATARPVLSLVVSTKTG
jgi:hypothetical protein